MMPVASPMHMHAVRPLGLEVDARVALVLACTQRATRYDEDKVDGEPIIAEVCHVNLRHYTSDIIVGYTDGGKERQARAVNIGKAWDEHAQTLDWLGISIHISSWGRSQTLETKGRATLAANNPLKPCLAFGAGESAPHTKADERAMNVHKWMLRRVHKGYHNLGKVCACT